MYRAIRFCFSTLVLCAALSSAWAQDQQPAAAEGQNTALSIPAQLPDHMPSLKLYSLEAFKRGQYADFVRVLEHARTLRPDDPHLMAQLVVGYAQTGQKAAAYTLMIQMQRQGLAFDFDQIPQTEPIRSTQVYDHINKLLKTATQPYGFAETAFTLPESTVMPEALAWDNQRKQLFVGDVREGQIARLDADGQAVTPAIDTSKLWSIFGLAVDSERDTLWVSSTAVGQWRPYKEADYGLAALVAFDLNTGQEKQRYQLIPDGKPHGFGNLTVAKDGSVYVADSRQPMVHVLKPGSQQLEKLFFSTQFTSLRGLAYNDDAQLLYVADRELGIAMWSIADQQLYRIHKPDTLNLSGLEGINYWNGHLFAIQNGIEPARVLQIRLGEDGRSIEQDAPMVAALDTFDGPSYGAVAGNELFFFAANHWPAFDLQGKRLPGTHINPVPVLKLPLARLDEQRFPEFRSRKATPADQVDHAPPVPDEQKQG